MKIAIIDDNFSLLDFYEMVFSPKGFIVHKYSHPLRVKNQNEYDLIICDYVFDCELLCEINIKLDPSKLIIISSFIQNYDNQIECLKLYRKPLGGPAFDEMIEFINQRQALLFFP